MADELNKNLPSEEQDKKPQGLPIEGDLAQLPGQESQAEQATPSASPAEEKPAEEKIIPSPPSHPASPAPLSPASSETLEPEDLLPETEPKEPASTPPSPMVPAPVRKRSRRWLAWLIFLLIIALAGGGWYLWANFLALPAVTPIAQNEALLYRAAAFPTGLARIADNKLQMELHNLPLLLEGDVYHAYLMRTEYRIEDKGRISEYNHPLRHDAYLLGSFVLDEEGALLDAKTEKRISSFLIQPSLLEQRPDSTAGGVEISLKIASSPLDKTGQVKEAFYQLEGITLLSGVFNPNWQAELEFPLVPQLKQLSGVIEMQGDQLQLRLSDSLPSLEAENLGFSFGLWIAKFQGPSVVKERELGRLDAQRASFSIKVPGDFRDFNRMVISLEPLHDPDPSIYDLKPFEARVD